MGELITEPKIIRNVLSARPAPGAVGPGDYFFAEDTGSLFQSNGLNSWGLVSTSGFTRGVASSDPGGVDWFLNGGQVVRGTFPRDQVTTGALAAFTSGVMYSIAVVLYAGDPVRFIDVRSGTVAAVSPTDQWAALYGPEATPALIAQSVSLGSEAWPANTTKSLELPTPYVVPTSGVYRIAFMMAAGTVINTVGKGSSAQTAQPNPMFTGQLAIAQTSGSSLAATAPATIAAPTTQGNLAYMTVRG